MKWFVRLVACLVFVIIIFQTVISISTGYVPFSYYLNTTVDKVIFLGIVISSFMVSVMTLFCSFQKVKVRTCAILMLIPIILLSVLAYKFMTYIPLGHSDGAFVTKLKADSKEECFKNVSCGTEKEILDSIKDTSVTKVACDYDDHCKPPLFLKNPKRVSQCLGMTWEWKCSNEICQCLLTTPLAECLFEDCP